MFRCCKVEAIKDDDELLDRLQSMEKVSSVCDVCLVNEKKSFCADINNVRIWTTFELMDVTLHRCAISMYGFEMTARNVFALAVDVAK